MAGLAITTLVECAFTLLIPEQLDEGEPLIYGLASRIANHQQLYQPLDRQPFVEVHYTPLYYALVALLQQLVGHGFAPGRLLSLVSGLICASLLGYLTAARARSWWAGAFAVAFFLAMAFPGSPAPFLVLERVDMLGVALSVGAVGVLSLGTGRGHLAAAGLLAGLAVLTKQSFVAAILAGALWLATLSLRKAGRFALVAALTVLIPSLLLQWASGGAYWDNIGPGNPSPTALPFGAFLFRELLVIQGVPTLLALLFILVSQAWRQPAERLLGLYWLATMLPVTGIIKVGANHNYWIELAAANAVLVTLGLWSSLRAGRQPMRAVAAFAPMALLAAQMAVLAPQRFIIDRKDDLVPLSWSLHLQQFTDLVHNRADFHSFYEGLRGEQGVILAEPLDALVLSDHPVHFEPFAFSMLEQERRWSSQPLVNDICAGRISLLVLSYPITSDIHPVGLVEFPMWPTTVMAALRQSMQLESTRDRRYLYRPKASPDAAAITRCQAAAAAAH